MQLATLKKIALYDVAVDALASPKVLRQIDASAEQRQELRRLGDKKEETVHKNAQFFRESGNKLGEQSLDVLAPPQREKFREELQRPGR